MVWVAMYDPKPTENTETKQHIAPKIHCKIAHHNTKYTEMVLRSRRLTLDRGDGHDPTDDFGDSVLGVN